MKVVFTGGVTGGHIYPALAVAQALETCVTGTDRLFIGGRSGMETRIVPPTGIPFRGLTTGRVRRLLSPSTPAAAAAMVKSYVEAKSILHDFKPDVVLGTGGYLASTVVLAAHRSGIPTVIVEPNAVSGRMNRLLGRWADWICIAYEDNRDDFPPERTVLTGVPIRAEIVAQVERGVARQRLGLDSEKFTLLAVGGSQGAQSLNELIVDSLPRLPPGIQVLHQTGERNLKSVVERAEGLRYVASHHPLASFGVDEMALAYRAADLVVCRCGTTVAEVTANGLPALLVPLPSSYGGHQTANARAIERGGGGILLEQSSLTGESLAEHIFVLHDNLKRLDAMARASQEMGRPEAAGNVARMLCDIASDTSKISGGASVIP